MNTRNRGKPKMTYADVIKHLHDICESRLLEIERLKKEIDELKKQIAALSGSQGGEVPK